MTKASSVNVNEKVYQGGCGQNSGPKGGVPLCTLLNKNKKQSMYTYK